MELEVEDEENEPEENLKKKKENEKPIRNAGWDEEGFHREISSCSTVAPRKPMYENRGSPKLPEKRRRMKIRAVRMKRKMEKVTSVRKHPYT